MLTVRVIEWTGFVQSVGLDVFTGVGRKYCMYKFGTGYDLIIILRVR